MAMVVALTPPTVSGANPRHALDALQVQKDALNCLVKKVLENVDGGNVNEVEITEKEEEISVDSRYGQAQALMELAREKRTLANTLCKDANKFHALNFLQVDPMLPIELDHLGMDELLIDRTIMLAKRQEEKTETGTFHQKRIDSESQSRLRSVLGLLEGLEEKSHGDDDEQKEGPSTFNNEEEGGGTGGTRFCLLDMVHDDPYDSAGVPTDDWEVVATACVVLQQRLNEREVALNKVKWSNWLLHRTKYW